MAVERDCLKLQNARKQISANVEFQYFPAKHAPRPWQDPPPPEGPFQLFAWVSNPVALLVLKTFLTDTQVFTQFICQQEILFFPVTGRNSKFSIIGYHSVYRFRSTVHHNR